MPQPPEQTCGNCRFMIDNYKDGKPRCHRYPPQAKDETVLLESESDMIPSSDFTAHVWGFPEVHKDDWCGEWQPIAESGNPSE